MSIKLWASYVIDWVFLVIFALIAYGFTRVKPNPHNFALYDLSISYPLKDDTVPIWAAGVAAGVAPCIIILAVCVLFVPGRAFARGKSASRVIRLKLWELHAGWLGLAMSLATSVMFTQGLKLFGKPRPNCLSRCQPDLSKIAEHTVGNYSGAFQQNWVLVDIGICNQQDEHILYDGFQSWPSGHSSVSWAGLLYLTLYLCAKFAVVLPYLPASRFFGGSSARSHKHSSSLSGTDSQSAYKKSDAMYRAAAEPIRHRDEAAAPPVYLLLFIMVPVGTAVYICLSRYMDYAHHGFDILSGSVLGAVCAYVSFRWYHLPIGQGSGWSWGPRSESRAFAVGVGQCGYVDEETVEAREKQDEVELGLMGGRPSTNVQPETPHFQQETGYAPHAQ